MKILFLVAAAAFMAVGCESGGGCDGPEKKPAAGQSGGMSGSGASHASLTENVSFQGLGKKEAAKGRQLGGAVSSKDPENGAVFGLQSVLCGGFANLPKDCLGDTQFAAVKKKCCPSGSVEQCHGVPGGARLVGRNCVAAP